MGVANAFQSRPVNTAADPRTLQQLKQLSIQNPERWFSFVSSLAMPLSGGAITLTTLTGKMLLCSSLQYLSPMVVCKHNILWDLQWTVRHVAIFDSWSCDWQKSALTEVGSHNTLRWLDEPLRGRAQAAAVGAILFALHRAAKVDPIWICSKMRDAPKLNLIDIIFSYGLCMIWS